MSLAVTDVTYSLVSEYLSDFVPVTALLSSSMLPDFSFASFYHSPSLLTFLPSFIPFPQLAEPVLLFCECLNFISHKHLSDATSSGVPALLL